MNGGKGQFAEIPWLWSDQYDMNLQIAGAPTTWDRIVVRGDMSAKGFMAFLISGAHVAGVFAVNAPREMRFARRLIAEKQELDFSTLADPNINLKALCRS